MLVRIGDRARRRVRLIGDRSVIEIDLGCNNVDLVLFGRGDACIARQFGWATTATNARRFRWSGGRDRCRGCGGRSSGAPSTSRGRSGLLFGSDALLSLPTRTNASNLIVGQ